MVGATHLMVAGSNPQSDDYVVSAIPVSMVIPVGWMGAADSSWIEVEHLWCKKQLCEVWTWS